MDSRTKPWSNVEKDHFMDLVLARTSAEKIANYLQRPVSEIRAYFSQAFYDPRYTPSMPRTWRGGSKITPLEQRLILRYLKRNYPMDVICKILQRRPNEISPDQEGRNRVIRMQEIAPKSDVLMAHHYLYYQSKPVLSDQAYDLAKKEELEFGTATELLQWLDKSPKTVVDYPPHIRALASYIQYKDMVVRNDVDFTKLPAYYAPDGYWRKDKDEHGKESH